MNAQTYQFLQIDFPAMTCAILAAVSCGLLGNFLVLRRMSLMGDAISHAVLPGLVVAFLISSSRAILPMFLGAAAFGILTAFLVETVRKLGRLESGAAMGVVFSVLFALGVLLLEQAAARTIDLDANCVLHGQLENIFWFPPQNWAQFFSWQTFLLLPREMITLLVVTFLTLLVLIIFYKELKISSFDPELATSLGINATLMHYGLMIMVAAAVVASFVAVGSILVIAMLICPAATARLLTDRLKSQIFLSVFIAFLTGALGYILAAFGPFWLGYSNSISTAGMITILGGIFLALAVIASPQYGLIAKKIRNFSISVQIAQEDLLGFLFRFEEFSDQEKKYVVTPRKMIQVLGGKLPARLALSSLVKSAQIRNQGDQLLLTSEGRKNARYLVRTHRLWENYLVQELGLKSDHVHAAAEKFEHFTSQDMQEQLADFQKDSHLDPHGRMIPKPENGE